MKYKATKECASCKEKKPVGQFVEIRRGKYFTYGYCKECQRLLSKKDYYKHWDKRLAQKRKYRQENPEKVREASRRCDRKARMEALKHYGGDPPKCACCGESIKEFLCLDHIDGRGSEHRRSIGGAGNSQSWLKRNNYPKGFQVLCHNCNLAKGFYGKCPHQK